MQGKVNGDATISVNIEHYTVSTKFSDLIYNKLIKPITENFRSLSRIMYEKLVSDITLVNIAQTMLILYVILYGLFFLAGAVQVTTYDLLVRVVKIFIVITVFSETSWQFFNDNLFSMFFDGVNYLITSVTGIRSSTGNIFGFIDPIFSRLIDKDLWLLILAQLLQFWSGLFFISIMLIYGMLIYARGVLEVIVSYCIAFVSLSIMTSLAPILITMILFKKTQNIFINWLSVLFSNLISPTILIIFFLFMNQFIDVYLIDAVPPACWGTLINFNLSIPLFGTTLTIPFPFLSSIKFYISEPTTVTHLVSSALLFFTFVKFLSQWLHILII